MEKRSAVELEVLYKVSQALAHRPNMPDLLQEVLDILETGMGMSYGTLTLRRPDTDVFVIEAARGLTPEEHKRGQYRLGEGIPVPWQKAASLKWWPISARIPAS